MNGIRPTVGIEFDDKYTNAKNKLLDFIKALDELDDIQKAKLAQEFITSYSMAIYVQILYLICDYPHKHYTFKHFEV